MNFDFATASRVIFGVGKIKEISKIAAVYGQNIFLVRGKHIEGLNDIINDLTAAGFRLISYSVETEPDIAIIEAGVRAIQDARSDVVIAIGGGSVLDAGKAIAALASNPGPLNQYLEVVGSGLPLENEPLPMVAIPTTAGTGSEVTRNAVISVPDRHVKVSLRNAWMLPKVALVDPALTLSMPPAITASSGMDALTQLIEPFVSKKANVMVDLFCLEGLRRCAKFLRIAFDYGDNLEARENMSWASLLGGLSLANAGLGAVHGFAGPLGGLYGAPHGALCAALLAPVMQVNSAHLLSEQPHHPTITRYVTISEILTSNPAADIETGIRWIEDLTAAFKIPGLRSYGISRSDFPVIIEKAMVSSSMKGNPVDLSSIELTQILETAW